MTDYPDKVYVDGVGEEDVPDNYYEVNCDCHNCSYNNTVYFKRGIPTHPYTCADCECQTEVA